MTRLTKPKTMIFELAVNESRDTVDIIETIAKVLQVAIGEPEKPVEYIQLRRVVRDPKNKELSHGQRIQSR